MGGNLGRPAKEILINAISATELGIKTGTDPILLVKKHSLQIAKSQVVSVVKRSASQGKVVKERVSFTYVYDGAETNVEFGIIQKSLPYHQGEVNSREALEIDRPYSFIQRVFSTSAAGLLNAADKKAIVDGLVAAINADPYRYSNANTVLLIKNGDASDASTFILNGETITLDTSNDATGTSTGYTITKIDGTYTEVKATVPGATMVLTAGTDTTIDDVYMDTEGIKVVERFATVVDDNDFEVAITQAGLASFLSSRDVRRQFGIQDDMGGMEPDLATPGSTYNEWVIKYTYSMPANTSAGEQSTRSGKLKFYVLDGQENVNVFKTTDYLSDAPASPDADFENVLAMITP